MEPVAANNVVPRSTISRTVAASRKSPVETSDDEDTAAEDGGTTSIIRHVLSEPSLCAETSTSPLFTIELDATVAAELL